MKSNNTGLLRSLVQASSLPILFFLLGCVDEGENLETIIIKDTLVIRDYDTVIIKEYDTILVNSNGDLWHNDSGQFIPIPSEDWHFDTTDACTKLVEINREFMYLSPNGQLEVEGANVNLVKKGLLFGEDGYEGMKIFDVSEIAKPAYIKNIDSQGQLWNILDLDQYVLMIERNDDFAHVVDISDPKGPKKVKTIEGVSAGYAMNVGDYVFLSRREEGYIFSQIVVDIWDFSDVQNPFWINTILTGVNDTTLNEAWGTIELEANNDHKRKIAVYNNKLYITNVPFHGCLVYEISNPRSPVKSETIPNYRENIIAIDGLLFFSEGNTVDVYNILTKQPELLTTYSNDEISFSTYNQHNEFVWSSYTSCLKFVYQGSKKPELYFLRFDKKTNQIHLDLTLNMETRSIQSFFMDKEFIYLTERETAYPDGGNFLKIYDRSSIPF